jgi:hypothetical protein
MICLCCTIPTPHTHWLSRTKRLFGPVLRLAHAKHPIAVTKRLLPMVLQGVETASEAPMEAAAGSSPAAVRPNLGVPLNQASMDGMPANGQVKGLGKGDNTKRTRAMGLGPNEQQRADGGQEGAHLYDEGLGGYNTQ